MRRNYFGLALGAILAVIAVVLLNYYLRGLGGTTQVPMTTVVVATQDLAFGAKLDAQFLRAAPWPQTSVPEGAFVTISDIFSGSTDPSDRIVISPLIKGEPVLKGKISGFGARPIMSTRVDKMARAISIRIDPVSGVSGFILPGDHVDVLLTRVPEGGSQEATDVIMQDIVVLGIDQLSDQTADRPIVGRTATVEATPEQAQKLVLAQQVGTLSLTLRNLENADEFKASRVGVRDLYGRVVSSGPVATQPQVSVRYGDGSVVTRPVTP